MKGLRNSVSPPSCIEVSDSNGTRCEMEPGRVLNAWWKFSSEAANPGQEEEEIFDEYHKVQVEDRLKFLQSIHGHQEALDGPIDREEIFHAIRKLKPGKAPGVDGILTTILKMAANATGNAELSEYNPVVDALELIFNFTLENEVWPERWSQGVVCPIFKNDGSRLNPGNYRPITLLSVVGKLFGSVIEKRLSDWSESSGVIADEQGGFRKNRGTTDLIFLLREIILSRKAAGLPTLATFIDAKKAYDSVWQEGNFVRLFDLGVQGKLWRQLQAMYKNRTSKVRLPFGETDWFKISKGVAQGAVESPWLYNCFINSISAELKAKGLGIRIAGILTPLLMYADDIVLLASSVDELRRMNQVISDFAFKNRYRFNAKKSAVMVFSSNKTLIHQVRSEHWLLSGEQVSVTDHYKYLGVDILTNVKNWSKYLNRAIAVAGRISNDLGWICRREKGLLPRTAMTIWKSVVRPHLEYAAEIWAGDVPKKLMNRAENVQTNFARSILGLVGCQSIANDIIRAELGLEKISSRWDKLRLGFWWKIHNANQDRTLFSVAQLRRWQVDHAPRPFNNGWMKSMQKLLTQNGLSVYWDDPTLCMDISKQKWKRITYDMVEAHDTDAIIENLSNLKGDSATRYVKCKFWDKIPEGLESFPREVGRYGSLVSESYLDDRTEVIGRRLKLMCRTGCLPVLKRIVREEGLPAESGTCKMCDSGDTETISHLILHCNGYSKLRSNLLASLVSILKSPLPEGEDLLCLLLGSSNRTPISDVLIDRNVKRFLKKIWRKRRWLLRQTNQVFNRSDTPWAIRSQDTGYLSALC